MEPCKSLRATVAETGGPCALEQGRSRSAPPDPPQLRRVRAAYALGRAIPGCLDDIHEVTNGYIGETATRDLHGCI